MMSAVRITQAYLKCFYELIFDSFQTEDNEMQSEKEPEQSELLKR